KEGVLDFLEKPVRSDQLSAALSKAVVHTREHRRFLENQVRLRQVASIQRRLAPELRISSQAGLCCKLTARCYPLYEAGGDFLSVAPEQKEIFQAALGDISGHGLQEGFIATYFQGMVRGMQTLGASAEQIAKRCNSFLLYDWAANNDIPCSLSAIFLELNLTERKIRITNCGCPGGFFYKKSHEPIPVDAAGPALGWFDPFEPGIEEFDHLDAGQILFWSDGLVDTADRFGVQPTSLAARLLLTEPHLTPTIFESMSMPDDIMVAKLSWAPDVEFEALDFLPIYHTNFHGGLGNGVDDIHRSILACLHMAIPHLKEHRIHNIALCCREAILNAIQHGCGYDSSHHAFISIELHLSNPQLLRIVVADSGKGFDYNSFDPTLLDPIENEHNHVSLGLRVIRGLADAVRFHKNGSHIEIDFYLTSS
ncbi:MAG: SpoIIE family protein phosphatase, partial [Chthoniobacterales bacterium]|nr:SpoIIE family protein phosphatase [Chthoniobacterales bacterium]